MTSYTLDEPCADAVLAAMADGRERTLNDIARRVPMCAERLRRTIWPGRKTWRGRRCPECRFIDYPPHHSTGD